MERDWAQEFKENAMFRMRESTERIAKCLTALSDPEIGVRPNESLNSVGNLVLHLCGNITQWIHSGLGGIPDARVRDEEFAPQAGAEGAVLMARLEAVVEQAIEVIHGLDGHVLLQQRSVQGFEFSGMGIVIHVVEHLSYHTGQIAFWTKLLKDRQLGFYAGTDLNRRNQPG